MSKFLEIIRQKIKSEKNEQIICLDNDKKHFLVCKRKLPIELYSNDGDFVSSFTFGDDNTDYYVTKISNGNFLARYFDYDQGFLQNPKIFSVDDGHVVLQGEIDIAGHPSFPKRITSFFSLGGCIDLDNGLLAISNHDSDHWGSSRIYIVNRDTWLIENSINIPSEGISPSDVDNFCLLKSGKFILSNHNTRTVNIFSPHNNYHLEKSFEIRGNILSMCELKSGEIAFATWNFIDKVLVQVCDTKGKKIRQFHAGDFAGGYIGNPLCQQSCRLYLKQRAA